MDFVKLNGTPVHVAGFKQRTIERPGDSPVQQFELVAIVRDQKSHESFLTLLGNGQIRIDLPDDSGGAWTTLSTVLLDSFHTTTASGNVTIYRHEITLRESTLEEESTPETAPVDLDREERLELRLEALIEQLAAAGVISHTVLDASFARLLKQRSRRYE